MKKLDSVIYNKLLLQAEEARDHGMIKLADAIMNAIESETSLERTSYAHSELKDDIHRDLWKVVTKLALYHDVNTIDALKTNATVVHWMAKMIDDIEEELGVSGSVKGPLEPKLPGETE
jgi:hypothetical protein